VGPPSVSPEGVVLEPIPSNEVTLTVDEPKGEDLIVWNRIQQAVAPRAWAAADWPHAPAGLAQEIFRNHPRSRYAQDIVSLLSLPATEFIDAATQAIAIDPSSMQSDLLRLGIAFAHWQLYQDAMSAWNLDAALRENAEFLRIRKSVTEHTPFSYIRSVVKRGERLEQTDGEVRAFFDYRVKSLVPATEPVVPGVDCIQKGLDHGGFVARFNYKLVSSRVKVIAPGNGNRLVPGVADQGQPRVFTPGQHPFVASGVSRSGEPVSWELDGRTATATADAPICPAGSSIPVRPVVECVRHENQAAVVSFGYDNPNRFAVSLPIGEQNRFSDSADAGQPALFLSGRQNDVFKVKLKDAPATWTLDGSSVTANPRDETVCAVP